MRFQRSSRQLWIRFKHMKSTTDEVEKCSLERVWWKDIEDFPLRNGSNARTLYEEKRAISFINFKTMNWWNGIHKCDDDDDADDNVRNSSIVPIVTSFFLPHVYCPTTANNCISWKWIDCRVEWRDAVSIELVLLFHLFSIKMNFKWRPRIYVFNEPPMQNYSNVNSLKFRYWNTVEWDFREFANESIQLTTIDKRIEMISCDNRATNDVFLTSNSLNRAEDEKYACYNARNAHLKNN